MKYYGFKRVKGDIERFSPIPEICAQPGRERIRRRDSMTNAHSYHIERWDVFLDVFAKRTKYKHIALET